MLRRLCRKAGREARARRTCAAAAMMDAARVVLFCGAAGALALKPSVFYSQDYLPHLAPPHLPPRPSILSLPLPHSYSLHFEGLLRFRFFSSRAALPYPHRAADIESAPAISRHAIQCICSIISITPDGWPEPAQDAICASIPPTIVRDFIAGTRCSYSHPP